MLELDGFLTSVQHSVWVLNMRKVLRIGFVACWIILLTDATLHAQQQDPVVGVQLKSTQWEYIRQVLGKRPHEEVAPLMTEIEGQINNQYRVLIQNQNSALEKAVRDKIAKEAAPPPKE
jgi:hypothetical protein